MKFTPKDGHGDLLSPSDSRYGRYFHRLIKISLYLQKKYPQIHFKAEKDEWGFYDVKCESISDYKIKMQIADTVFRGNYLPEDLKITLNRLLFE